MIIIVIKKHYEDRTSNEHALSAGWSKLPNYSRLRMTSEWSPQGESSGERRLRWKIRDAREEESLRILSFQHCGFSFPKS